MQTDEEVSSGCRFGWLTLFVLEPVGGISEILKIGGGTDEAETFQTHKNAS